MRYTTLEKLRRETVLILRKKDGDYLVGTILNSNKLRWSNSPWAAWRTREKQKAVKIAEKTGTEIFMFNPIVGQVRKLTL